MIDSTLDNKAAQSVLSSRSDSQMTQALQTAHSLHGEGTDSASQGKANLLGTGDEEFPGSSVVKNPPANAGHVGSIPGSGRLPGEGNGNQLQYSCLENSMYG